MAELAMMATESWPQSWQRVLGHNLAAESWLEWQQKACHDGSRKLAMMVAESLS